MPSDRSRVRPRLGSLGGGQWQEENPATKTGLSLLEMMMVLMGDSGEDKRIPFERRAVAENSRKHEANEVNENKLQSPIAFLLLRSLLYLTTLVAISSPRAIMADYNTYRPPPWLEEVRPLEISHKPLTKPSPPLDIEIVFVAGSDSPTIKSVCEHFAHDFGFYCLCINEYVVELSSSEQHDREAYGIVHPDTLATLVTQTLSDDAVAFFILPILRYKVELEMSKGFTKFLLVGCGQYPRTALKFAQEASSIFFTLTAALALTSRADRQTRCLLLVREQAGCVPRLRRPGAVRKDGDALWV